MRTFLATLLALTALTASAGAKISWDTTDHNFGAFSEDDGNVTCEFRYTNTGDEPLVIVSARASCGCTIPRYSTKPVAPGQSGTVTVEFNPTGRPGRFEKKVYIDTNTEPSRSNLYISGTVIGAAGTLGQRFPVDFGPVRLRNGVMLLGEVTKGRIKSCFLEGYNNSGDTLHPAVVRAPKYLEASVAPEVVPPGEQFSFVVCVRPDNSDLYGVVEDTLTVVADPALAPELRTVPTVAIFNEDFSKLSPGQRAKAPRLAIDEGDRIDLGRFSRTAGPITATATLRNSGQSRLSVRRAYSGDHKVIKDIQLDRSDIKPGRTATLTLTIDPAAAGDYILNERISIITNDPDHPTTILRLVGEPKD